MKFYFLVFFIAANFLAKAQGIDTSYCKKIVFKKSMFSTSVEPLHATAPLNVTNISETLHATSPKNKSNTETLHATSLQQPSIINAFDPNALPFFCKIEYKMGLTAKVPIKIRLGDPDKVDEMEKKGINH